MSVHVLSPGLADAERQVELGIPEVPGKAAQLAEVDCPSVSYGTTKTICTHCRDLTVLPLLITPASNYRQRDLVALEVLLPTLTRCE
jgi:hypothetical protein